MANSLMEDAMLRFENMWVTHPRFKENIRIWWNKHEVEGYEGFCFMKKLQHKKTLKVWNTNTFEWIWEKKESIWREVDQLDRKMEEDGSIPPDLMERRKQLLGELRVFFVGKISIGAKKPNVDG